MEGIETLSAIYKQAKEKRIVLNEEEFARAIGISRATLYRYNKEPDKVDVRVLEKAKNLLRASETKSDSKAIVVDGNFNQLIGQRIATTAAVEAMLRTMRAKFLELEHNVTKRPYAELALEFDRIAEDELQHILETLKNDNS